VGVSAELDVRVVREDDLPAILELLGSSLGWVPDEQYAAFYRWKHQENPFGPSPAWVALDGERVVGLRVWMRWRFVQRGRRWDAVRAVDTATHPDHQGRGIFRRLTVDSLETLAGEGVGHVFNTPNDNSRPGYLKMGWVIVGRLPVAVRFRSPISAAKAVRARVPADKWSLPCDGGSPAPEAMGDDDELTYLIGQLPVDGISTDLSPTFLRWRYGFGPLHYRAVRSPRGLALFRLRRRGPAVEAVVGHVLAPQDDHARLLRMIARASRADQVLQMTRRPRATAGFLPLPGGGPVLTWRAINDDRMPPLDAWRLTMGDVELF
jgi:GNAT superfamily N-acetyltransferase